jgi:hypothetical protein
VLWAGDVITLKYKDGEKKIIVTPQTVIVTYVPGDKSELKSGAKIFRCRRRQERGRHARSRLHLGRPRRPHAADVRGLQDLPASAALIAARCHMMCGKLRWPRARLSFYARCITHQKP